MVLSTISTIHNPQSSSLPTRHTSESLPSSPLRSRYTPSCYSPLKKAFKKATVRLPPDPSECGYHLKPCAYCAIFRSMAVISAAYYFCAEQTQQSRGIKQHDPTGCVYHSNSCAYHGTFGVKSVMSCRVSLSPPGSQDGKMGSTRL